MKYPNFFIVGFPKSGTTALYNFLKQHPQVYMPEVKEPHYFCTDFHKEADQFYSKNKSVLNFKKRFKCRKREDYLRLFGEANEEKAIGEASVHYLYSKVAAQQIYEFHPEAKIIISLRNPVDFIRSWYQWNKFDLLAEGANNIREALELEKHRKRGADLKVKRPPISHLCYKKMAKYYNHVREFLDYFPDKNVKIILFDHFVENNRRVCKELYDFLGVNSKFEPDLKVLNKSSIPRHIVFRRTLDLKYVKRFRELSRKCMPNQIFKFLKTIYDRVVYKNDRKISLPDDLKKDIKYDLRNNIGKLNNLLNRKKLISSNTDLMQLWNF